MSLNIVLVEPVIPQNTGNIGRTCVLTGTSLHLIKPLGFSTDDKNLKRAGLDYWHLLDVHYYENFEELLKTYPEGRFFYATTKTERKYSDVEYQDGDFIVFGKETEGLPEDLIFDNMESCIKIPMKGNLKRSLNLSNSANIIIYEALRQLDFPFE